MSPAVTPHARQQSKRRTSFRGNMLLPFSLDWPKGSLLQKSRIVAFAVTVAHILCGDGEHNGPTLPFVAQRSKLRLLFAFPRWPCFANNGRGSNRRRAVHQFTKSCLLQQQRQTSIKRTETEKQTVANAVVPLSLLSALP